MSGYLTAVRLAPDNVQYYNNLALGYMALGDYKSAVESCDTCLKIDPTYSTAHYNLANALLEVKIEPGYALLENLSLWLRTP